VTELKLERMLIEPDREWSRPGAYRRMDGMSSEVEVSRFLGDLTRLLAPRIVIETGSHRGFTAAEIARALDIVAATRGVSGHLWTFETDPLMATFARERMVQAVGPVNAERFVTVVEGALPDHATQIRPVVDLAFVDSAWGSRADDIEALEPLLSDFGVIALHDTMLDIRMRDLVTAMMQRGYGRVTLPTPRGLTLLQGPPGRVDNG
jgi:predicted O-methyltransferase YrrM